MFQNILVCSDGSEKALEAAQAAAEIATKFQSKVTILSVYQPSAMAASIGAMPGAIAYTEPLIQAGEEVLETVMARTGKVFEDAGIEYETLRELGHPVDRTVETAKSMHADLIVLGSRGLGGFQRFLLGSTSDGVVHHAPCPVLIIR